MGTVMLIGIRLSDNTGAHPPYPVIGKPFMAKTMLERVGQVKDWGERGVYLIAGQSWGEYLEIAVQTVWNGLAADSPPAPCLWTPSCSIAWKSSRNRMLVEIRRRGG